MPSNSCVASSPRTVVLPCSSRKLASIEINAARASGAAPPNMPECIADSSVSTLTTTLATPRRLVVKVGCPTVQLPESQMRMASASSNSGCFGTKSSMPPEPCSSEPSPMILMSTPASPASARSAVRWTAMLPLQSAAPRPYQRPSRSVSSHAGDFHALRSIGGCTSW
ncbi:Uncharacterised protein [Mycobacteroides abscessus subsp. abscessus]|nr:Uncharacterised protein [Mycobacteroides abscessus subsp. abscessus]